MFGRRCGALLVVAVLASGTLAIETGASGAAALIPTTTQSALLGSVYTNTDPCTTKAPLAFWTAGLGRAVGVYSTYGPDLTIADAAASWGVPRALTCWAADYPTAHSVVALPAPVPTAPVAAADLASYSSLATAMKQINGGNDTIRLGWEFNGSWMPWSVTNGGAYFVANWQKIVTTMRAIAPKLTFDWNVSDGYAGTATGLTDARNFYPGDAYVDSVGVDVYDEDWSNCSGTGPGYPLPANDSYADMAVRQHFVATSLVYGSSVTGIPVSLYGWYQYARSHGKGFDIDEWGLDRNTGSATKPDCAAGADDNGGNDDPTFVDMVSQFLIAGKAGYAIYFDYCDVADCTSGVDARITAGYTPGALSHLVNELVVSG